MCGYCYTGLGPYRPNSEVRARLVPAQCNNIPHIDARTIFTIIMALVLKSIFYYGLGLLLRYFVGFSWVLDMFLRAKRGGAPEALYYSSKYI